MFGSSGFGGFGQQNNQQQQQQQPQQPAGGLFGQPQQPTTPAQTGFGTSTGFGSTGGFGAAQPAAQTGGGLFGQQPSQTQTPSFGGFGASNNNASTTGAFGARPAASTGFGGFGAPANNTSSSSFTFGSTPNQQQQQQPATGGFGSSTFGSAAPATGGLFGQQQQQQQPAAGGFGANTGAFGQPAAGAVPGQITQGTATVPYDPLREDLNPTEHIKDRKNWDVQQSITVMPAYSHHSIEELRLMDYQQGRSKGNTGPGATAAPSTGFGFGASNTSTGAFGQPQQQSTGFGATSNTPNTGGLFGQPQQQQQSGGLFGQQNNQQQTGGLFGAKPATTGFGASTSTGGLFGQQQNQPQTGGLFGQQQQPQQQPSSSFSFGSQPQQPATGTGFTFGANNNAQQQQNKPAFGFGASTTQPGQTGSTGFGFGANNNQQQQPQTGTGFGTGATGTTGGFSFGQKPATGGLFGAATSQPGQTGGATSTFGGFGANNNAATQNKPAFGFGAGGGFGGASGAGTGTSAAPAATGGLFGASTSQPSTGGLFGSTNTNAGGAAGTTGGFSFGANNNQQANQQPGQTGTTGGFGGGLFGAKPAGQTGTQPATGGLFGGSTQAGQQAGSGFGAGASTGGGLFGSTANKPATGGFSFGTGGGSSLFGNNQNTQQQGAGGLGTGFGQTQNNASGGLFGQNNQNSTGTTGGGLFGGASNTGGSSLFGNTGASSTGGGLFGSSTQNNSGGGLFGGLGGGQNQQASGLFGQSQQNQQQSSLLQNQQQQPTVQASLDSNPYGTDSLFASNPINGAAGGSAANGSTLPFNVAPKNKPPLTTPFRSSPRGANKINRLRGSTPGASGLGSSSFVREGTPGSFREGTPGAHARFGTPGRAGSPALFKGLSDEYSQPLSSQAYVSRPSAKRLVLDDAGENSFSASRIGRSGSVPHFDSGSSPAVGSLGASAFRSGTVQPGSASRVTFSPALEQRAESVRPGGGDLSFASSLPSRRGNFLGGASSSSVVEDTPLKTVSAAAAKAGAPRQGRDLESSFAAPSTASAATTNGSSAATGKVGEYYTEPSLAALRTANYNELTAVHNFIVGRKGVGQIEFLEPVDLTSIEDLNDIVGGIVQIRLKEVVVYPEEDDYDPRNPKDGAKRNFLPGAKAKQGTGLNVPARVSLEACWPTDRATRDPIKDAEHPRVKQMINKLKNKPETEFVDFEPESGTWTFKVKHFSRYGLDDSDEDEEGATGGAKQAAVAKAGTGANKPASKRLAPMTVDEDDLSDDVDGADDYDDDDDDAPPPLRTLDDGDMDTDDDARQAAAAAVAAAKRRQQRQWTPSSSATGRERGGSATPSRAVSTAGNAAEARRVQVMQASFFGQDDSKSASVAVVPAKSKGASLSHKKTLNLRPSAAAATLPASAPAKSVAAASLPLPAKDGKIEATPAQEPRKAQVQEVQRPAKKLRKLDVAKSDAVAADGEMLDAGLSLGRSFRVGWGPDGTLVHNGKILIGNSVDAPKTEADALASAKTSTLVLERIKLFKDAETSAHEASKAEKLLGVQLEHTNVELDDDGVPTAYTDFATRFRHFATSFEHKDRSFEASLWRLGVALFDEIELRIPEGASTATADRIRNMRRKAALSDWLRHTVAGTVESEARSHIAASRRAALLFSLLSGNQVERAVNAALDAGDLRLATLIAQAGGDEEVRADISEQLLTWRKEGVDAHITRDHRRVYELLSGNVLVSKGTDSRTTKDPIDQVGDLPICEGLDWKRAFALFLWYESPYEAPLEHSFERYESQVAPAGSTSTGIAPPLPWYRESTSLGATRLRQLLQKTGGYDRDALFEMIKLYVDPTCGLEPALNACAFGPSNVDARLPWHLYNLLSRVLQRRDFGDRIELGLVGDGDDGMNEDRDEDGLAPDGQMVKPKLTQGNSARADTLASAYGTQLELLGLWKWSAFVLLHLELGDSREAAIKALLARNVAKLDSERDFLCDRLLIPESWLYEAKSYEARARDDRYGEYQLLLKAHNWTAAHNVAALHLAPEAIIRGDHELVTVLFSPFYLEVGGDPADEIAGWADGAALYIDYVAASREIPGLAALLSDASTRQLALEKAERYASRLPTLASGINALLSINSALSCFTAEAKAGERTHMVARTEMIAGITNLARTLVNVATATGGAVGVDAGVKAKLEAMGAGLLSSGAVSGGGEERGGWDAAALEVDSVQAAADDYLCSLIAIA